MKIFLYYISLLFLPITLQSQITNVQIFSDISFDGEMLGIVEGEARTYYLFNDNNELFEIRDDIPAQLNFGNLDFRFSDIEDLWFESGDSLLFMTRRRGLYRYSGGEAVFLSDEGEYFEVAKSSDGIFYIGSESTSTANNKGFGKSVNGGASFTFYPASSTAMPTDIIYDIEVDTNNVVWIATFSGLVRYDGNNFTVLTHPDLSDTYYDVDVAPDNSVWVSSAFGGLATVRNGVLVNFPQFFNFSSTVNQVTVDNTGGAWTEDNGFFIRLTDTDTTQIPIGITGLSGGGSIARELFADSQKRLWVTMSQSNDVAVLSLGFPVGVFSPDVEAIRVYPNPVAEELVVDLSGQFNAAMDGRLELSDMTGRKVLVIKVQQEQTSIQLEGLAKGVYILALYDGQKQIGVQKLLVK